MLSVPVTIMKFVSQSYDEASLGFRLCVLKAASAVAVGAVYKAIVAIASSRRDRKGQKLIVRDIDIIDIILVTTTGYMITHWPSSLSRSA